jgi:deoxyribose-phosphate aldolase
VALEYDVASVCIKPYYLKRCAELVAAGTVAPSTVIGFPHGGHTTAVKVAEADAALADGGKELDMVVNIGKVLSQDWDYVAAEVRRLNEATVAGGALLKVIFENDYLPDDALKVRLCQVCSDCAVAFVKTSTGYGFVKQANGMYAYQGATDHHLRLMREHCPATVQVKAAGGVRTLDDLLRVRGIGVTRIGATATKSILEEAKKRGFR